MRLDTSQQMRTDMRLRMAPRMIQSMEILQLPLMALQERIDQELSENPVLVDLREAPAPEAEAEESTPTVETTPAEFDGDTDGDAGASAEAVPEDDWAESFGEGPRLSRAALSEEADRKHDAMQNMASRPRSLHDDLIDQLGFLDCDPAVRVAGRVHHLQPRRERLLQLTTWARSSATSAATSTLAQAEEALALVQKLDPPGVGARNLRECLLLQLTPDVPCRDILQVLISQPPRRHRA